MPDLFWWIALAFASANYAAAGVTIALTRIDGERLTVVECAVIALLWPAFIAVAAWLLVRDRVAEEYRFHVR